MKREATKPNLKIPKDVSNTTIRAAGILGCFVGVFGIHDFMTKRRVLGALHLGSIVLYVIYLCVKASLGPKLNNDLAQTNLGQYLFIENTISQMYGWSLTLLLASQIWGMVEGVAMLNSVATGKWRKISHGGIVLLVLAALSAILGVYRMQSLDQVWGLGHAFEELLIMMLFTMAVVFLIVGIILVCRRKRKL